uniref:Si:dkey-238c7.16 n=1 Tax=Cyprinus carpio carpio TaxID=630221 RepID=A0A9J7YAV2_CYPCA
MSTDEESDCNVTSQILPLLASTLSLFNKGGRMGAKLSRKKSEAGIGAETTGPAVQETETAEGSPVAENAEQKCSEGEIQEESKPAEEKSDSSTSVLQSLTQAVGETVTTVTEQIAAPVEDVVNKGIEAVESALASVSLIEKEPVAPEKEPEQKSEPVLDLADSDVLQEPSLLDDLLKSPISEALISGVTMVSEAITSGVVEDKMSNPAPAENKDLLECLDKAETPSVDLLDCKLTHESTIPNSDPSFTLEDMGQNAADTVNLI